MSVASIRIYMGVLISGVNIYFVQFSACLVKDTHSMERVLIFRYN